MGRQWREAGERAVLLAERTALGGDLAAIRAGQEWLKAVKRQRKPGRLGYRHAHPPWSDLFISGVRTRTLLPTESSDRQDDTLSRLQREKEP